VLVPAKLLPLLPEWLLKVPPLLKSALHYKLLDLNLLLLPLLLKLPQVLPQVQLMLQP
jgi:hypothetical protein